MIPVYHFIITTFIYLSPFVTAIKLIFQQIFEHVVKDNLKKLPEGHSFTLLTYGASGSGKTYTLMGTVASPGLVPRSLEYVFRVVDAAQTPIYKPSDGGADKLNYAEQDYEVQVSSDTVCCHNPLMILWEAEDVWGLVHLYARAQSMMQ